LYQHDELHQRYLFYQHDELHQRYLFVSALRVTSAVFICISMTSCSPQQCGWLLALNKETVWSGKHIFYPFVIWSSAGWCSSNPLDQGRPITGLPSCVKRPAVTL
jgi:hypothetical protein